MRRDRKKDAFPWGNGDGREKNWPSAQEVRQEAEKKRRVFSLDLHGGAKRAEKAEKSTQQPVRPARSAQSEPPRRREAARTRTITVERPSHQAVRFRPMPSRYRRRARRDIYIKRAVGGVLAVCLVVAVMIGVPMWQARTVKAARVYIDGREAGLVQDVQAVEQAFAAYKEQVQRETEGQMVVDAQLTVEPVAVSNLHVMDAQQVAQQVEAVAQPKSRAAVVAVGDQTAVAVQTEEEAQWVVNQLLEPYKAERSGETVESAAFVEEVTVEQSNVSPEDIRDKETALSLMRYGATPDQVQSYTVQQGDTLSEIAQEYGVRTSDLRAANPQLVSADMIDIGDELSISKSKGLVNVQTVVEKRTQDTIDFETEYQDDADMVTTQKKVIQEGEKGTREVVAEITYVNGIEVSRNVLSETVTKQPVKQIVARGTKKASDQAVNASASSSGFLFPTQGRISSRFGQRWGRLHAGLDIANVVGTPVHASKAGTVSYAGWRGGYGKCVMIDHGNGVQTLYGHNSKIQVTVGQKVSAGETIALMGSTGNSTGPHCHFEIRINGSPVNPETKL